MKKITAMVICFALVLSMVGCGNSGKDKIHGDTTIQIGEVVYYNTKEAIPAEPDESVIIQVEKSDVVSGNDKITCYAFINEDTIDGEILLGMIDGEWYKFLPKRVTAETN